MHCWWGCCEAVGGLFLGCFTFNPFIGIDVASDCSSHTGGTVASWLYWLSFSAIRSNASPRPHLSQSFPPCPPSYESMNAFLVCSEEYSGAHHVIIVCLVLSLFLNPCLWNLWGRGVFWDGALRRPKRNAGPLPPRGTEPTAQKSVPLEARQSGTRAMREVSGAVRPECPPLTGNARPLLSLVCLCFPHVVTWQWHRWGIPPITSKM